MNQNLEHGHYSSLVLPQHPHSSLAALPEHPFDTSRSKPVYDISGEPERYFFRCRKYLSLLKGNPEIYMDQLSSRVVDENIVGVTIPQSQNMTNHRVSGCRLRVC